MESHSGKKIEEGLQKILSAHGYGFHYAVLRNAMELFHQGKSKWVFEVAEFPVTVRGFDTRIDFILRAQDPFGVYWGSARESSARGSARGSGLQYCEF
jgi:hypothetical protein